MAYKPKKAKKKDYKRFVKQETAPAYQFACISLGYIPDDLNNPEFVEYLHNPDTDIGERFRLMKMAMATGELPSYRKDIRQ